MNLFLLGWDLPNDMFQTAVTALRQMVNVYHQLDPDTLWHLEKGQTAFAASMHTATEAAEPRRYVWRTDDQVTFYEGSVIDQTGRMRANSAAMLAEHWDQLASCLEGQYVVARVVNQPPCIELMTDFLGMEQVYYLQRGGTWLVSNSVSLLAQIAHTTSFDPLGTSLLLSMGWVGADRTLRRNIRVIPGGQRWTWQGRSSQPSRAVYYPLSRLSRRQRSPLTGADVEHLADDLMLACRHLARSYGELLCPLTSGRDSRVLASLLIGGGIPAQHYTSGDQNSIDVKIGRQIAETFHLPHEVYLHTTEHVLEEWETASRRLIQQNDGMVSLWQIADVLRQPSKVENLRLSLWGIGGEIARGFYSRPEIFLSRNSPQRVQNFLCRRLIGDHGGLIRREATALARQYIQCFVQKALDQSFPVLDIPDVFYTVERVRRWAGSNARKSRPASDRFSPFCTRPFVEAAFSLPPSHRCSEPIHYALIRLLTPELHDLPFGKGPWRSQFPLFNLARMAVDRQIRRIVSGVQHRLSRRQPPGMKLVAGFNRAEWLEAKNAWLRELCLDQSDSPLWDFVDRPLFERITAPGAEVAERRRRLNGLYDTATVFLYATT
jgi:asparagine synthase (glutamine-hydrolysing)